MDNLLISWVSAVVGQVSRVVRAFVHACQCVF